MRIWASSLHSKLLFVRLLNGDTNSNCSWVFVFFSPEEQMSYVFHLPGTMADIGKMLSKYEKILLLPEDERGERNTYGCFRYNQ